MNYRSPLASANGNFDLVPDAVVLQDLVPLGSISPCAAPIAQAGKLRVLAPNLRFRTIQVYPKDRRSPGRLLMRQTASARRFQLLMIGGGTSEGAHARHEAARAHHAAGRRDNAVAARGARAAAQGARRIGVFAGANNPPLARSPCRPGKGRAPRRRLPSKCKYRLYSSGGAGRLAL